MVILNIKEMSCEHCVQRISKALEGLGINYEVDLESKTVKVNGDEKVVNKVIDELDDLGFTAIISKGLD